MRILLKEAGIPATSESVLVLPQGLGNKLETLSGETVEKGVIAEVDAKDLVPAIEAGAKARNDEFVSAKDLLKDIKWLNKALAEYEVGSKVGLKAGPRDGFVLDDSEATRPDRAEGLADGDTIAVGPTISPRTFMNARGRVVAIEGDTVVVELDPGDRDRIQRATGKKVADRATFPRACVEKTD